MTGSTSAGVPYLKTDFISCPHCRQTYAAYRSAQCPHLIPRGIPPSRQLTAGDGQDTRIAVIPPRKHKPKPKPGPRVLEAPYYGQQAWEKIGKGEKRWRAFSLWMSLDENRSYAEVSRRLGYSNSKLVERWAGEDKWPVRLNAYRKDKADAELAAVKRKWKQRTEKTLTLIDSGLELLSAEFDARLKAVVEDGQAGEMSPETLISKTAELTKLIELLQGRATEHVTHDTPEMQREKAWRDAVNDTRQSILDWQAEHPDASPAEVEEAQARFLDYGSEFYPGIDRAQLAAAVVGPIDESSVVSH